MTSRWPTLTVAALLLLATPGFAQDEGGFTWENATELSFAATSGNASSNAFAASLELTGSGGPHELKLEAGGLRTSSKIVTRTASGSVDDFVLNETTRSELSAASYRAKARYDRAVDGAFVFAGGGWERNTFSGFNHRVSAVLGLGRTWVDSESGRFKTDFGATYTVQKDVIPVPGADDSFAGLRFSYDAVRTLTSTTDFTSKLAADGNLDDRDDYRIDWLNSIAVSITEGLALKTSYQILYDHQPALISVPLVDGSGLPTGETVVTPGDEVDTVLTLALVINF